MAGADADTAATAGAAVGSAVLAAAALPGATGKCRARLFVHLCT
jgi:hypothetical protein